MELKMFFATVVILIAVVYGAWWYYNNKLSSSTKKTLENEVKTDAKETADGAFAKLKRTIEKKITNG